MVSKEKSALLHRHIPAIPKLNYLCNDGHLASLYIDIYSPPTNFLIRFLKYEIYSDGGSLWGIYSSWWRPPLKLLQISLGPILENITPMWKIHDEFYISEVWGTSHTCYNSIVMKEIWQCEIMKNVCDNMQFTHFFP